MKKVVGIILLSLFAFAACNDSSTTLEPIQNQDSEIIDLDKFSLNKPGPKPKADANVDSPTNTDEVQQYVYNLGEIKDYKVKASKNFKIKKKHGGKIELKVSWEYDKGQKVELSAKLDVPKNAFKDNEIEFDMIFNLAEYNLELYPSPFTFDKAVKLDLKFKNIDLDLFNKDNLEFNYIDGLSENIKYKSNKIDKKTKTIEVHGAELHHFSRYGWTRRR